MNERLLSTAWYRVADRRPRLGTHARIHRHHYRGALAYVVTNPATQRSYRCSPDLYTALQLMDGKTSVNDIWTALLERLDDRAPSQDQIHQLSWSSMLQTSWSSMSLPMLPRR